MRYFTLLFLLLLANFSYSAELSAEMFSFDEEQVYNEFAELSNLEAQLVENPQLSELEIKAICADFYSSTAVNNVDLQSLQSVQSSGNMSYFWTTFAISAVGSYFIYSAVAGPIAVAVIYFTTNKDMDKTKKAAWGCAAGTVLGVGLKYAISNL